MYLTPEQAVGASAKPEYNTHESALPADDAKVIVAGK